jgi:hypothetical protein
MVSVREGTLILKILAYSQQKKVMENIQNTEATPQEELELQKIPVLDEVKASLIEKFGLDEELDSELLNKLTEHELESRKSMSTAIKQKIS